MLTNGASYSHCTSIKECLGSIVSSLLQSYFKEAGNKHGVRVKYETQNRENEPRESSPGQSAESRAFDVDVCPSASASGTC